MGDLPTSHAHASECLTLLGHWCGDTLTATANPRRRLTRSALGIVSHRLPFTSGRLYFPTISAGSFDSKFYYAMGWEGSGVRGRVSRRKEVFINSVHRIRNHSGGWVLGTTKPRFSHPDTEDFFHWTLEELEGQLRIPMVPSPPLRRILSREGSPLHRVPEPLIPPVPPSSAFRRSVSSSVWVHLLQQQLVQMARILVPPWDDARRARPGPGGVRGGAGLGFGAVVRNCRVWFRELNFLR